MSEFRFFVVCDTFTAGPFLREEQARRKRDGILHVGGCPLPHRIERHRWDGERFVLDDTYQEER